MRLDDIGFYTMTDERAATSGPSSRMMRCEILITDQCNFACPYCRGMREDCRGEMSSGIIWEAIKRWTGSQRLYAIRFSGGEPTTHWALADAVYYAKKRGVERIAVSTNGTADCYLYQQLIDSGVNDFSISLDACCAASGDKMAGKAGEWDHVIETIRRLAASVYVTVGVVVTPDNVGELKKTLALAHDLGVADIRVIPSAQWSLEQPKEAFEALRAVVTRKHPILAYRFDRMVLGLPVRGLRPNDSGQCWLAMDDSVVAGKWHFPCIIHLREGGEPIGELGPHMRAERVHWVHTHDSHADPICKANCLDVCVDYNNKCRDCRKDA